MELICEACGAANRPGTPFCVQCHGFLAWDGSGPRPEAPTAADPASAATPTGPAPIGGGGGSPATPALTSTLVAPVGETCPTCALVNTAGLRFCAHCGYGFASSVPARPGVPSWGLSPADADRAARREYRRSLPPLYRWRRVLIGVLVAAAVVGGLVWVRHPVEAVRNGWYALDKRYVAVDPVLVAVEPAQLTAGGSEPAAVVDRSVREWTGAWQPTGTTGCGAAPGTAELVLTFPPTRIRQLQVVPGLDVSNPRRAQQPLPRDIGVTFAGGACRPVTLTQGDRQQPIRLDSGVAVTSVRIGIASVYPAGTDDAPLVSITEVVLQSFPR